MKSSARPSVWLRQCLTLLPSPTLDIFLQKGNAGLNDCSPAISSWKPIFSGGDPIIIHSSQLPLLEAVAHAEEELWGYVIVIEGQEHF